MSWSCFDLQHLADVLLYESTHAALDKRLRRDDK